MKLAFWRSENRDWPAVSLFDYAQALQQFGYLNNSYSYGPAKQESIDDYAGVARLAYKSCSVVFACMDVRAKLFSEARFQWRQVRAGKTGDLFGTPALQALEEPWPGGTTGDLLYRMIQQVDLGGNAFLVRRPGSDYVTLLRPDWVDIVAGSTSADASAWDADVEVAGYLYFPGGRHSGKTPVRFFPEEVAHFAPIPDPQARFRGMSWLTPVIREIQADKAATLHKLEFFENGATPNMKVKFSIDSAEKMKPWVDLFKEQHEGAGNAYKTLFIGAGTDAEVIGSHPEQIDFKQTQGAGETRIAAAAGVPPVIVGLSEGLQAATYSNYSQARRRFADGTMRPLWRNICGSIAPIMDVPDGAELWYDDRDIPALKEDIQDKAKELQELATAANQFVSAGYDPDSIILALSTGDLTQLKHSGLVSVQLQPPGANSAASPGPPPPVPVPATNGSAA